MGMDLQKVKAILVRANQQGINHGIDYQFLYDNSFRCVQEALAELEKPADVDAMAAWKQLLDHFSRNNWRLNEDVCLSILQQYAEAYHAKKCRSCLTELDDLDRYNMRLELGASK